MSNVLTNLEPSAVFEIFEQICDIPHGSGNTGAVSDFVENFAKRNNLEYIREDIGNVTIFVPGKGMGVLSEPVIIQGHLDMVCEKEKDKEIDFTKDGLELYTKDGFVGAAGTTLGADDGIAVAMALALAECENINCPPLELVFTVDEEIGMLGAEAYDTSVLKGRILLNLDSEDEGYLLASCSGGAAVNARLPYRYRNVRGYEAVLTIDGCTGGHSGQEIHKYRANANMLLARVLYEMMKITDINIMKLEGGMKDNAIPRTSQALIMISEKTELERIDELIKRVLDEIKSEYANTDPGLDIGIQYNLKAVVNRAMDDISTIQTVTWLMNMPCGVQKMNYDIKDLVQSSLNLGILCCDEKETVCTFCVRSMISTEKQEMIDRISSLTKVLGGSVDVTGNYPAWKYNKDSKLINIMSGVYEREFGKKPVVYAIHAGVECGYFAEKIPGVDCVSFGPNILDIHTPSERMEIDSVKRTWDYLLLILKNLC